MAYFSNGCEGEVLDMQCSKCLIQYGCPVKIVQLEYNYSQLDDGNEMLSKAMDLLIDDAGTCQVKLRIDAELAKRAKN